MIPPNKLPADTNNDAEESDPEIVITPSLLPVIVNDPVIPAFPVYGNVALLPGA
jgi:hypothetical protein